MKKNVTQKSTHNWFLRAIFVAFILISTISSSFSQILINENFDGATLATGWAQQNLSTPIGPRPTWFKGVPAQSFNAFNGAADSYWEANYQNVPGTQTLSNWLFTPTITVKNGDQLTFYSRTQDPALNGGVIFPDRLEVRLSTNGASVNAGTTNTSVGDYTTVLLEINPTLIQTGPGSYPFVWTKYTATVVGVPLPVQGRIAFRYFVTNNANGDFADHVGIDQVVYDGTPCTNTPATAPIVVASELSVCAGTAVTLTPNGALNNSAGWRYYTASCGGTLVGSGNSAVVTPTVTTTYYVRGEGGCGTTPNGNCGTVTINVTACSCTTPSTSIICDGAIQKLTFNPFGTTPSTYSSTAVVNMPAGQPGSTSGNFGPYPSTVVVSGLPTTGVQVASINFNGISHTWSSDLDIVLVSPTGVPVILLSDAAGGNDYINANIVFRNGFPNIPAVNPIPSGTYSPTNLADFGGASDNFPAPGPGTLTQGANPTLSSFVGNLNGTWQLYGLDQVGGDFGKIDNWSITFAPTAPPTVTWTGGANIFTNAAATTPYIAGTNLNSVWVQPSATTTYVANVSSGTCAGANNILVTVLPRPVVTLSTLSGCGPLTVTASGAVNYNWTPAAGLSTTIGATITANPLATTTYSVTGLASNGCSSLPVGVLVNSSASASVISSLVPGLTFQIDEGFDAVIVTTPNNSSGPAGWSTKNQSNPLGITGWFQGNTAVFNSFDGAANAYIAANFNNTTPAGTISNWLFSPTVNIKNGDVVSFYTRTFTGNTRPDRVQLRMSLSGSSTDVGTTATSVGDFSAMLVEVNPTQGTGTTNFPDVFTKYTAIISGVTGTVSGKFALRYFLTNGGNVPGTTSNFFGIDRFQYGTPPSGINCANNTNNIKVDITGGVSPYKLVYSDGTNNFTYNSYISGSNINVAPAVTTTYSIVSVTGANGCVGLGNSGSANITVTPTASITTQPTNKSICVGANTTFVVVPSVTGGTTYLWEVNPGTGVWAAATGGVYSGGTTATLTITGATAAMLGYTYRVTVTGFCGGVSTSTPATLTVVTPAAGTATLTNATVCSNATTTLTLGGTLTGGPGFTYQYQVSTDGGTTFTNITNGGIYSGATTTTLTISNPPIVNPKYQYRVAVNTVNACGGFNSTVSSLTVNTAPVVTISAAPVRKLFPSLTSTLTAAVSSATAPLTYQWFRNGTAVTGATNNTTVVNIDGLGVYTVRVSDANGCISNGGTSTPGSIAITDSVTTDRLFIYPSPNSGQFQVRWYTDLANGSLVPGLLNIYDSKGSRVFTGVYTVGNGYKPMNVDLGVHGKGVYRVDLLDFNGNRLKTGSVMVF